MSNQATTAVKRQQVVPVSCLCSCYIPNTYFQLKHTGFNNTFRTMDDILVTDMSLYEVAQYNYLQRGFK